MGRLNRIRLNKLEKTLLSRQIQKVIPFQPWIWPSPSNPDRWEILSMRGGFESAEEAVTWYEAIAKDTAHADPVILDPAGIWKEEVLRNGN